MENVYKHTVVKTEKMVSFMKTDKPATESNSTPAQMWTPFQARSVLLNLVLSTARFMAVLWVFNVNGFLSIYKIQN